MIYLDRIYYVYEWYFKDTGKVFYVGKGKGRRYKEKKDRNDKFIKYVNKFECESRKVYINLTEDEAYSKEIETIAYYKSLNQCECNFTIGGDAPPTFYGKDAPNRRIVVQLSLEGNFIKEWDCISDVEREYKVNNSLISRVCNSNSNNKLATSKGFIWMYKEDYELLGIPKIDTLEYFLDKNNRVVLNNGTSKVKILQYRLDGTFVKEWDSATDIQNSLGYRKSGICSCCAGKYKSSNGYLWRYKTDNDDGIIKEIKGIPTPIIQLSLDGEFIKKYNNATEAILALGKKQRDCSKILDVCKGKRITAYKYKWKYEYDYLKDTI